MMAKTSSRYGALVRVFRTGLCLGWIGCCIETGGRVGVGGKIKDSERVQYIKYLGMYVYFRCADRASISGSHHFFKLSPIALNFAVTTYVGRRATVVEV
ncbi:uncharacterized protein F4822DRAFT_419236 [Hypoxylon trugodes]|uniref:uncharacterized protein n=1 Tax=Hypoxylon trugodes TaxID=326681 RepID=UPI00219CAD0B|nr:uncharacterized protein F4822DRAFT_419236 [Hypoxylon trugodes]KAI1384286.1 hypothetical protein F4822DRAFT_419236 [Hypoxylon trugodes]